MRGIDPRFGAIGVKLALPDRRALFDFVDRVTQSIQRSASMLMRGSDREARFANLEAPDAMLRDENSPSVQCFRFGEHRRHLSFRHGFVRAVFDCANLASLIYRANCSDEERRRSTPPICNFA